MEFILNARFFVGLLVGFFLCHLWSMKKSAGA